MRKAQSDFVLAMRQFKEKGDDKKEEKEKEESPS